MTRTIHDMTDAEVSEEMFRALPTGPSTYGKNADACATVARRLAGPDPRHLAEVLRGMCDACEAMIDQFGQAPYQVASSCERARAALDAWEKGNG